MAGMVAKYKSLKLPTMFRPENIIEGKESLKDGKIPLPVMEQNGATGGSGATEGGAMNDPCCREEND